MERPDDLGSLEKLQTDLVKLEDPLEVATVGCFSSGKSTLINALVRAKVCETGKLPVTMKLRRIPYQNGDHIILIDTMGVDAKDFPKHKEETADAIANADAVIFVVSANNLGTTGDGDIEDMLRSCKTPGILVVTHWDQVEEIKDQKAIRERAQELAGHLFPQQDKKTVFFVDAKSAESQRALKKAVVQSNNSDFVKLEKCIQTKLADKGNKQRIKLARVLNKLLSLCQSKVDLLNQRIEHLQKKTWEAEMEQVEEDFRQMELRLEETIPVQAERARWSRQRFSDREHDAKRARNVSRELAMLDPAQNGGALDSVLKGAWGGANAAFRATEGNLNATMLGSVFGGIAGIFNAWSEASNEEQRRIENKKTIKEFNKEAKALKDSLPGLERKWEDEENRLKELENQYSQLRGKRDKEKAKVTRQQKNANKIQERCRDLISRFDQHLHRIRELIKDQKCFWVQFSPTTHDSRLRWIPVRI